MEFCTNIIICVGWIQKKKTKKKMQKSDLDRKEIIFNATSVKTMKAAPQGFFCQDDFPEIDEGSDD